MSTNVCRILCIFKILFEQHVDFACVISYLARSPPTFIQRPADTIAVEGHTAKLVCRTSSGPRITWTRDNHQVAVAGRISVTEVGALIITLVEKADEGIYACFASNQDGHITASAKLTVKGKVWCNLSVMIWCYEAEQQTVLAASFV